MRCVSIAFFDGTYKATDAFKEQLYVRSIFGDDEERDNCGLNSRGWILLFLLYNSKILYKDIQEN